MACKFLEISSGANLLTTRFEITEVELGVFMLKTRDSHAGILRTLDKLLKSNYSLGEPGYTDLLWERSSSMRPVLSKCAAPDLNVNQIGMTGPTVGVNNIPDESVWDDDATWGLVAGPRMNLEEMVEEADQADNFFIGGYKTLMLWSVSRGEVTKDYGDIMAGDIWSMVQTSDKKYLFLSDQY